MAKPVSLDNGRTWPTRSAALGHFKAMLGRYEIGDDITSPADHDDLLALLRRYDGIKEPGTTGKIGAGVDHFSKQWAGGEGYATPCFYVHQTDGIIDDFSYRRAINDV